MFTVYVIGVCVSHNNVFHDNAVWTPYSNIKPSQSNDCRLTASFPDTNNTTAFVSPHLLQNHSISTNSRCDVHKVDIKTYSDISVMSLPIPVDLFCQRGCPSLSLRGHLSKSSITLAGIILTYTKDVLLQHF